MWKAYVHRKGIIEFGAEVPERAVLLAEGERGLIERVVKQHASSSISPGKLIAVSVFESSCLDEALDEILDFKTIIQRALAKAAQEEMEIA